MAAEAARSGKVRTERKLFLTLTGFLMEGVYASLRLCFAFLNVNECNRDVSPIDKLGDRWVTSGWPTTRCQRYEHSETHYSRRIA